MADAPSSSGEGATTTLNILCQILPPPGRFTIENLPLTITVGQLRARISETFPGNPHPSTQRLIYQGKALLDDNVTLGGFLPSTNDSTHALHLVLPPPEPTHALASGASHPSSQAVSDRLRPLRARPFATGTPGLFGNSAANPSPFGPNPTAGSGLFGPNAAHSSGFGSNAPAGSSPFGPNAAHPSGFGSNAPAGSSLFGSNRPTGSGLFGPIPANPSPFGPGITGFGPAHPNGNPFGSLHNTNTGGGFQGFQPQPAETDDNTNLRLANLRSQTEEIERQLERGLLASSMRHIVNVRTELLGIQDAQFNRRRPLPEVGALIARIMDAYTRVCQLENMQLRERTSTSSHSHASANLETNAQGRCIVNSSVSENHSIFIMTGPGGSPQVILAPGAQLDGTIYLPGAQLDGTIYSPPAAASDAPVPPQPPQNAAIVENVFRQAMPNQQRRGNNIEQAGLARHMSRIWLFVRLWFVCYLTSEPGTWRRYIMVAVSMLVTLLSETEIPQQILRAVITPAQRHLEALARVGGPADPAATANDPRFQAFSMREQLRRIERSILLLLASVVPGLGEREVEAHYAAERGAELRRQEQEQAQAQEQQAQTTEAEGSTNPAAQQEAPASQPEPTPAQN
ncbi:hypothetical protein N7467_008316 [Penicillium canescens]|nr:hypothetical protein N7467_008316 [Penicillium canescens]